MMGKNKNKDESIPIGFTLIELLVVVAIVGLLASIVMISIGGARVKAKDAKRKMDIKTLSSVLEYYRNNTNDYPVGEDDTGLAGQQIDMSSVNSFIPELISNGYLGSPVRDPGGKIGMYWYVYQNSNPNNISIRQGACGAGPPEAKAVLVFWLERGVSSDYRIWYDSFGQPFANAICLYE